MQNVKYLIIINLQEMEIGLRDDNEYYYLDWLITKDDVTNAIQRYKKLKTDSSLVELDITNNKHKLILITNILTEYLLSVK